MTELGNHGYEERMVRLVHQSFEILDLFVVLLLDVILHLMRDKATCDLISHLAQKSEVIRCEVLVSFLIGNLKDSNSMIAKLDWNEEDIPHDLMQFLIHGHVITKLFTNRLVLSSFEMPGLTCVEDLAEDVWLITLSLEAHWLTQATCDDLAKQLVFDTIVEEDRASFNVE